MKNLAFVFILAFALTNANAQQGKGKQPVWTYTEFPGFIKQMTHFGERADWSHDGKKILFVGRTFGDVYEVETATGKITPVTHHYYHGGYTRALYLSNGDILLSGPKQFNPDAAFEWRRWQCELWVLDKSLTKPPHKLGAYCFEGPCVSRTKMTIAWTQNFGQESRPTGRFVIWKADINYDSEKPYLANQELVIDNSHPDIEGAVLEVQNFRPPDEKEIIFQSTIGVETFGFHTETGALINYSLAPETHEEPEGIFPDGKSTLVESDREASVGKWPTNVDFYRLPLDGSGKTQRLSFFAESGEFRGTNPVVSDDGKYIAFQLSPSTAEAGVGIGIFVYDIEEASRVLKLNLK
ncbi:MAG: PD40 domain-containing protein [Bacteroidales bacterium]|nr:PD40 domain-containing protein [Bacteroidales bacterium]